MGATVFAIQQWISLVLTAAALVLEVWALVRAVGTRPAAYPAVRRMSRTIWLVILGVATLMTLYLLLGVLTGTGGIGFLTLIGGGVAIFYLVDVLPRVREVAPDTSRRDGPYAGW